MKNVINDVKNDAILNNEYTNDTNDRSPQRELSTPRAADNGANDDDSSTHKDYALIEVQPFKQEKAKI